MNDEKSRLKKLTWLGLLLCLLLPFFFVGGPGAYTPTVISIAWDFGHYLFFSVLAWWCFHSQWVRTYREWLISIVVVFLLGGLIEILQGKIGRDGNWGDVWRDLAGYGLGSVFAGANLKWLRWAVLPGLVIIAPNLKDLGFAAGATLRAYLVFPKIQGGYETIWDLYPGRPQLSRKKLHATEGEYSLEVNLSTAQYAGVNIRPLKRNWSGFQTLHFDVTNPDSQPLNLVLRVNDVKHDLGNYEYNDRFNKRIQVSPGVNHYVIALTEIESAPDGRKMRMNEIISMMLFATKLPAPRKIYLDNVHLE